MNREDVPFVIVVLALLATLLLIAFGLSRELESLEESRRAREARFRELQQEVALLSEQVEFLSGLVIEAPPLLRTPRGDGREIRSQR